MIFPESDANPNMISFMPRFWIKLQDKISGKVEESQDPNLILDQADSDYCQSVTASNPNARDFRVEWIWYQIGTSNEEWKSTIPGLMNWPLEKSETRIKVIFIWGNLWNTENSFEKLLPAVVESMPRNYPFSSLRTKAYNGNYRKLMLMKTLVITSSPFL